MRRWLLLAVVVLAACGGAPALTARGVVDRIGAAGVSVGNIVEGGLKEGVPVPATYTGHADFAIGDRSGQAFVCATKRDCDAIYAYFDALRLLAGPYLYQSAGGTVVVQLNSELDASTAGKVEQVVRGL